MRTVIPAEAESIAFIARRYVHFAHSSTTALATSHHRHHYSFNTAPVFMIIITAMNPSAIDHRTEEELPKCPECNRPAPVLRCANCFIRTCKGLREYSESTEEKLALIDQRVGQLKEDDSHAIDELARKYHEAEKKRNGDSLFAKWISTTTRHTHDMTMTMNEITNLSCVAILFLSDSFHHLLSWRYHLPRLCCFNCAVTYGHWLVYHGGNVGCGTDHCRHNPLPYVVLRITLVLPAVHKTHHLTTNYI